jgi:hypothetical protein
MNCLVLIAALALLVLVMLTLHQRRHKRLRLRWWAPPVLVGLVLASLPMSFVTTVYFLIQSTVMAPADLALWITEAWRDVGRFTALIWVIGFPLVIRLKGVEFTTPKDAVRSVVAAIAILLPLTVLDAGTFWMNSALEHRDQVAAVSLDGGLRVTAARSWTSDASRYRLVCEANQPHPFFLRDLGSMKLAYIKWPDDGGKEGGGAPMPGHRLAWSRDGRVVALWFLDWPLMAYDFSQGRIMTLTDAAWALAVPTSSETEDAQAGRFRRALDRLVAEHGGPAGAEP